VPSRRVELAGGPPLAQRAWICRCAVPRGWREEPAPAERVARLCHDGRVKSPSEVRVRSARLADQAVLLELDVISWSPESGFPSVMAPDLRDVTFFGTGNPPEAHLVAELDGSVVGYIRLKPPSKLPENAHVVQVQGLAVHPEARRRGVATGLLDTAEATLRERGTRKLTLRVLSTNEAAIRLYERHGFVREGTLLEEFCINGRFVDDVMMAKKL
jgi:ribosomal protein S18 acetylase RimI-like enzyme